MSKDRVQKNYGGQDETMLTFYLSDGRVAS
jgi:hypothetical protein